MGTRDWHWFRFPFLHEGADTAQRLKVRRTLSRRGYSIAAVTMSFEDYLYGKALAAMCRPAAGAP